MRAIASPARIHDGYGTVRKPAIEYGLTDAHSERFEIDGRLDSLFRAVSEISPNIAGARIARIVTENPQS